MNYIRFMQKLGLFLLALVGGPAFATITTTTVLMASSVPSVDGQAVTLTATIQGPNGNTQTSATGSVTFDDNGTAITGCGASGVVTVSSGVASCTISTLAVGSHPLTATYGGDGTYSTSTSSQLTQTVVSAGTTGTLDFSFNTSGFTTTQIGASDPNGLSYDTATSMIVQPDGKAVVAGISWDYVSDAWKFAIVRYNTDGSLDSSFGSSGKVTLPLDGVTSLPDGTTLDLYGLGATPVLALQSDGKILAAGSSWDVTLGKYRSTLIRFNTNGTIDHSFGINGVASPPASAGANLMLGNAIAIQSNGSIVVAGKDESTGSQVDEFAMIRYTKDGVVDTGFGTAGTGIVTTPVGTSNNGAAAMLVDSSDNIVLGGSGTGPSASAIQVTLARYGSNGTLDATFGASGIEYFGSTYVYGISSLALQGSKIVAGARTGGSALFAVARFNSDGSADTSFGVYKDGLVIPDTGQPVGATNGSANAVAVQSDGKIMAAGSYWNGAENQFSVARIVADGGYSGGITGFDSTFGASGGAITSVLNSDNVRALTVLPNGNILTAGSANDTSTNSSYFALVRYTGDPITTPVLTSSANPAISGGAVTLNVLLPSSTSGTVTIYDSGTGNPLTGCSGLTISSNTASCSYNSFSDSSAPYVLYAKVDSTTVQSANYTQEVLPAQSVQFSSSADSSQFGESVTLTAQIADGGGTPITAATGTVAFNDNGSAITGCGSASVSSGVATCTTSAFAVGSHPLTAAYSGDSTYSASTGSLTQVVDKATTTTALTASPNPSSYGQSVTLTATVKDSGGTTTLTGATGTVAFNDNGSAIAGCGSVSVSSGVATCTTSALAVGSHPLTAVYSGDSNYITSTGSQTQTVNKVTTTTALTASPNPSSYGQSVTLTATIKDSGGTTTLTGVTGTVAFNDNGSAIAGCGSANVSNGVATCTTSALAAGSHPLTAVYSGDSNYGTSTSGQLTQTVNTATTTTGLTSSQNPSVLGQTVTLSATVKDSGGTTTLTGATGTMAFNDGGTAISGCSAVSPSNGVATCQTSALAFGTHTLTAVYSGDGNYSTSTSSPLTQTVNAPGTLAFAVASQSVLEKAGSVTLTVSRTNGTAGTVTVHYASADGTAKAGTDYTAVSGTLSWADGDSASKTITIPIVNDGQADGNETFTVTLSSATGGAALGTPLTETVMIKDKAGLSAGILMLLLN